MGSYKSIGTPSYASQSAGYGALGSGTYSPMDDLEMFSQPTAVPSWMPATKLVDMSPTRVLDTPNVEVGGLKDWLLGTKDAPGMGNLLLGTAQAGLGAFLGMKQYGLAKKQFEFQKDAWNKEYEINKNLTNERLETRQNRRNAEKGVTGMNTQDTASYMARYGVK